MGGTWAFCLSFFILIFYHVDHSRTSHYNVGRSDYMPLPDEMEKAIRGKRILPFAPARSISPTYAIGLPHNIPSAYGIYSDFGRDNFNNFLPEFQAVQSKMASPSRKE